MANEFNYYLGVDGNWTNAAGWSEGTVPAVTEQVVIGATAASGGSPVDLNTNLIAVGSGIAYSTLRVTPHFAHANLGTAALPLAVGSVADVWINAPLMESMFLNIDTGDTITNLHILACAPGATFNIMGLGTVTNMYVMGGLGAVITATGIVTNLFVLQPERGSPGTVTVEEGAALTTVNQNAGTVNCSEAFTTLNQYGGVFNQVGLTNFNLTTANVIDGALNYHPKGGTLATLNQFGGRVDLTGGERRLRVITNANLYGGVLDLRTGGRLVTLTNAPTKIVGTILGDPGQDFTVEDAP